MTFTHIYLGSYLLRNYHPFDSKTKEMLAIFFYNFFKNKKKSPCIKALQIRLEELLIFYEFLQKLSKHKQSGSLYA